MAVDGTSGAMNDLTPNPLHVDLDPQGAAATAAPEAVQTAATTPTKP